MRWFRCWTMRRSTQEGGEEGTERCLRRDCPGVWCHSRGDAGGSDHHSSEVSHDASVLELLGVGDRDTLISGLGKGPAAVGASRGEPDPRLEPKSAPVVEERPQRGSDDCHDDDGAPSARGLRAATPRRNEAQPCKVDHRATARLSGARMLEEKGGVRPEETSESHRRGFVGSSPTTLSALASLRRQRFEEEHPGSIWPLRNAEQALEEDYASSEYRTKSWPNEAQLEGWCPSFEGEHRRFKAATEPISSRSAECRQPSAAAKAQQITTHDRPGQNFGERERGTAELFLTPTLPRRSNTYRGVAKMLATPNVGRRFIRAAASSSSAARCSADHRSACAGAGRP